MDLGGFLQTYVLGNPFQSPNTNVSTSQKSQSSPAVITPKQTKAKSKRKPSTEQRRDVTAPSSNGSGPVSPILIIPSMQNHPDSQSTVSGDDASSSQNEDPLIRLPDAPPMPVPISPPDGDSGVVGLGHVGSNAAYAASLEKRKVADAHRPVQSWSVSMIFILL